MKIYKIKDMENGWFVGDFKPTVIKTNSFEVAYKEYKKGEKEKSHYHKIAKELTMITEGEVLMNGVRYHKGDIIVLEPGEITDFSAVTDSKTIVVKIPSVRNDKFLV